MMSQRISAAAIVLHHNKILLVRYRKSDGSTFLAGPGGGVMDEESLMQAVVREVREETELEIRPHKILFTENFLTSAHRMTKIWFLCSFVSGTVRPTSLATEEGIVDAGWYSTEQLAHEVVYPTLLKEKEWSAFLNDTWQAYDLPLQKVEFL